MEEVGGRGRRGGRRIMVREKGWRKWGGGIEGR